MTRRTGLMALFAIFGWTLRANAQTSHIGLAFHLPPQDLTLRIGGPNGYQNFHVTDGVDTVTFTAKELMNALRQS